MRGLGAVGVAILTVVPGFLAAAKDPTPPAEPLPVLPGDTSAPTPSGLFPLEGLSPDASPGEVQPATPPLDPFLEINQSIENRATVPEGGVSSSRELDNYYPQVNSAQIVSSLSQQALSNGESLFSGLGGVPNPLSARYVSSSFDRRLGFILGPAWVAPSLSVGAVFREQRGGGNLHESYATISPGVALSLGTPEAGRTLLLQYLGVVTVGDTQNRGTYDQSLQINGFYRFTKLTLGVDLQASQLSGADQDFGGGNVNRLLLALSGTVTYEYSERVNFDSTLTVPIRQYAQGNSSEGVTSQTFANYVYSPLTTVGVGFGLGTLVVAGQTQVFEQALVRFRYLPTPKLSFDAKVGYEFRQTGAREENTPIFRVGVTWQPQDGTSLVLSGERSVYNSAALSSANFITTSVSLTGAQRIGRYVETSVSLGYNDNSYEAVGGGNVYARDEQYFIAQAGLTFHLGKQLNLLFNAYYSYLDSSGGAPGGVAAAEEKDFLYGGGTDKVRVIEGSMQLIYEF